jgi:hypothetical protein
MAPHIEANSLSDITQLASNPPKYPRNPTEPRRVSLTLYIARVPGNKGLSFVYAFPVLGTEFSQISSSLLSSHN